MVAGLVCLYCTEPLQDKRKSYNKLVHLLRLRAKEYTYMCCCMDNDLLYIETIPL